MKIPKRKKVLNIALVNSPISGHQHRGTGTYIQALFKNIKSDNNIRISLVKIDSDLSRFDLIHYPYFDPFFLTLPLFSPKPTVVTVHDLIPLKYPHYFRRGIKGQIKWMLQKLSLSYKDSIITVSHASKTDIHKYAGIDNHKINVIYSGVEEKFKIIKDSFFLNQIKKKHKLPEEFMLYVGDINYNKNIPGVLETFSQIHKSFPHFSLLLVGKGFVDNSRELSEINRLISKLNLKEKIINLGFVSFSDLIGIYNLAKIYIQLSFAEGFGLTILEAMACGCPVVASKFSCLPEIVGDARSLVNPTNINEVSKSISQILKDKIKRDLMIKKGLTRVKKFRWKKCAQETSQIYHKILS